MDADRECRLPFSSMAHEFVFTTRSLIAAGFPRGGSIVAPSTVYAKPKHALAAGYLCVMMQLCDRHSRGALLFSVLLLDLCGSAT
jgi:hypothetical protein